MSSFLLYFVSLGTHMYKFCESQSQDCEYMKRDSQVKKITVVVVVVHIIIITISNS